MRKIQYVIGTQFGDEGKGKTVQYLCKRAIKDGKRPLVVRYCSGPQASHTVFNAGIGHVCSSFGSGVLLGVPTLIISDPYTFIDPIALKAEYDVLKSKGLNPKFYVDENCTVITPYDIIANRKNEESIANGTCGCGVWETMRRNIYDYDCGPFLFDGEENNRESLKEIRQFHGLEQNTELEEQFLKDLQFIKDQYVINDLDYDVIIMESSQGLLLDGRFGLKPYTTPCQIRPLVDLFGNINSEMVTHEDGEEVEFYLCTRTYTTRHGAGYNPKPTNYINYPDYETNKDNEFQGNFKVGMLDVDLINRGIDRHCLDNIENVKFNLVINHMDCLKEALGGGTKCEFILNGINYSTYDIAKTLDGSIRLKFENIYLGYSKNSEFTIWTRY